MACVLPVRIVEKKSSKYMVILRSWQAT